MHMTPQSKCMSHLCYATLSYNYCFVAELETKDSIPQGVAPSRVDSFDSHTDGNKEPKELVNLD